LGFSDKLGIRFNLLGRTGVFSYFKVCFDERDFALTFSPYEVQRRSMETGEQEHG